MYFHFSDLETKRAKDFSKKHYVKHSKHFINLQGISFILSPTGIGNSVKIICNDCGEQLNITDYESW
jgi:hypothetical protein